MQHATSDDDPDHGWRKNKAVGENQEEGSRGKRGSRDDGRQRKYTDTATALFQEVVPACVQDGCRDDEA